LTAFALVCVPGYNTLRADSAADSILVPEPTVAPAPVWNEERIFGIIPNFQTVNDPDAGVMPLTAKQKWSLFLKATMDPFNVASAALGSGLSQIGNEIPNYGGGGAALGKRFGAAWADMTTQNLFSTGVLACLLHQDPRYFRKGPRASVVSRVAYSVSRLVVARKDSGAASFNASGIFGMTMGIAASNLYYPSSNVRGSVMAGRLTTSLTGGILGNLMSEFWPDIQRKLFHKKH
jgi:hypothetical protein